MKKIIALTMLLSPLSMAMVVDDNFTDGCYMDEMKANLTKLHISANDCSQQFQKNNYEIQHLLISHYLKIEHYYAFESMLYLLKNPNSYMPESQQIYPVKNYARKLGEMYQYSTNGAPLDGDAAEYMYKFSIKLGDIESMKLISELYSDSRPDLQSKWIEEYNQVRSSYPSY